MNLAFRDAYRGWGSNDLPEALWDTAPRPSDRRRAERLVAALQEGRGEEAARAAGLSEEELRQRLQVIGPISPQAPVEEVALRAGSLAEMSEAVRVLAGRVVPTALRNDPPNGVLVEAGGLEGRFRFTGAGGQRRLAFGVLAPVGWFWKPWSWQVVGTWGVEGIEWYYLRLPGHTPVTPAVVTRGDRGLPVRARAFDLDGDGRDEVLFGGGRFYGEPGAVGNTPVAFYRLEGENLVRLGGAPPAELYGEGTAWLGNALRLRLGAGVPPQVVLTYTDTYVSWETGRFVNYGDPVMPFCVAAWDPPRLPGGWPSGCLSVSPSYFGALRDGVQPVRLGPDEDGLISYTVAGDVYNPADGSWSAQPGQVLLFRWDGREGEFRAEVLHEFRRRTGGFFTPAFTASPDGGGAAWIDGPDLYRYRPGEAVPLRKIGLPPALHDAQPWFERGDLIVFHGTSEEGGRYWLDGDRLVRTDIPRRASILGQADLTGDGVPEVLVTPERGTTGVWVYGKDGRRLMDLPALPRPEDWVAADLDGDGRNEVVAWVAEWEWGDLGHLEVWRFGRDGIVSRRATGPLLPRVSLGRADLDGDGRAEILIQGGNFLMIGGCGPVEPVGFVRLCPAK